MSTILSRHSLYVEKNIPSKYYLESEQQELASQITKATEKLKMLAIASPSEIVPKDEDPVCSLSSSVDDWVDLICEYQREYTEYQNVLDALYTWEHESTPHVLGLDIHNKEDLEKIIQSDHDYADATYDPKTPFRHKAYTDIKDYISDLEENLKCRTIKTKRDLYIAYYKNELVIDEEMNILYNSEEEAYEAIYKMMKCCGGHFTFDKYLQDNPQMYNYFISVLEEEAKELLTALYNHDKCDFNLCIDVAKHIDKHLHSLISKDIRIVKIV